MKEADYKKTTLIYYFFIGLGFLWVILLLLLRYIGKKILGNNLTILYFSLIALLIYAVIYVVSFIKFLTSKRFTLFEEFKSIEGTEDIPDIQLDVMGLESVTSTIESRLVKGKFKVARNIEKKDLNIKFIGSRNRLSLKFLGILSQYIIASYIENPNTNDFKNLYNYSLKYAEKNNKIPLPLGMLSGYMIFPCIISPTFNEEVLEYVCNLPRKHWYILEFPIAYELNTGKVYFFKGKLSWQSLLSRDTQKIVNDFIVGDNKC